MILVNIFIRLNLLSIALFFARYQRDLNIRDFFGVSLTEAIIYSENHLPIKPLIKLGWKPSGRLYGGMNILSIAVAMNKISIFNELIKLKVVVDRRNMDGSTPLIIAAQYGRASMMKALLKRGADPLATDTAGWTGLQRAKFYKPKNWKSVVKLLSETMV